MKNKIMSMLAILILPLVMVLEFTMCKKTYGDFEVVLNIPNKERKEYLKHKSMLKKANASALQKSETIKKYYVGDVFIDGLNSLIITDYLYHGKRDQEILINLFFDSYRKQTLTFKKIVLINENSGTSIPLLDAEKKIEIRWQDNKNKEYYRSGTFILGWDIDEEGNCIRKGHQDNFCPSKFNEEYIPKDKDVLRLELEIEYEENGILSQKLLQYSYRVYDPGHTFLYYLSRL